MKSMMCLVSLTLLFVLTCAPDKVTPLALAIYQPHTGDTVRVLTDPLAGKTTPGALVDIGFDQGSVAETLVPDDTGGFSGTYTIPEDLAGPYSVWFTVRFQSRTLTETRTVNYKP